jgi:16S rRNA (uracil1498-N3)-methyltransferase
VARRLHATRLFVGHVPLDPAQARHAREVLRLQEGDEIELFDDAGAIATGTLVFVGSKELAALVKRLDPPQSSAGLRVTVASAVPKGERADWMVEKLSELGVAAFIPLSTERSVVKPEGKNKVDRWIRIATESAKQSRRAGVMRVDELRTVADVVREQRPALYLSTAPDAKPIQSVLSGDGDLETLMFLIGPEGGWTDAEIQLFATSGIQAAKLTSTILRIETAAIAAAAVSLVLHDGKSNSDSTTKARRHEVENC